MRQFFATFLKDLLILWRDRAGMLVLFVMPMALVLVVSMVQNNVLEATGQAAVKVLLVDMDQGRVGEQIRDRLPLSSGLKLIETLDGNLLDEEKARALVAAGDYQFGLLIRLESVTASRPKSHNRPSSCFGRHQQNRPKPLN